MDEKKNSSESPSSHNAVPSNGAPSTYIKPQGRSPHDSDVLFEEYHYYAQRTRAEESALESPNINWRELVVRKKKTTNEVGVGHHDAHLTEVNFANKSNRLEISDREWTDASRMFRTAGWGACELNNMHCGQVLIVLDRFLFDNHRHSWTIWNALRVGHFGLGTR
jgi:hypothetical protein